MSLLFPILMGPVGVAFLVMSQFSGSWLDFIMGTACLVLPGLAYYLDTKDA